MKSPPELEADINREVTRLSHVAKRGNSGATPTLNAVLEACKKAAAMIRDIHTTHAAEGETLAKHLEQIGENISAMCREAANQVRELRIMPKEMAESTANDLISIGEMEARRNETVTRGLLAARDAILGINKPAEEETNQ